MAKYLIIHNKPDCIGCGACTAITPDFWTMNNKENKSELINGTKKDNGWEELEIEEADLQQNKDAAESCPVNVIQIKNSETGENLI